MTDRAKEIIAMRDQERSKQEAFWQSLWQETADLMYPREDQINNKTQPGEDKSAKRYDDTAIFSSARMASGLSSSIIPSGKKFFGFTLQNPDIASLGHVRRWMMGACETLHAELFESNFMMHFNESLRNLAVFGTCCIFSEYIPGRGLNFKDHSISTYQIKEDSLGRVDSVMWTFFYSARQALQEFGAAALSKDILDDAESLKTESQKWEFIHIVRPRSDRNPLLRDSKNMPFESVVVEVKGENIVEESGFEENPYAVARWQKGSNEKYGRGQGTEALATVRVLNKMVADFMMQCNRIAKPPIEKHQSVESDVDLRPGAVNIVPEMGMIKGIDQTTIGNPLITKEVLDQQRALVKEIFYENVFSPISDLTQRMTATEVEYRKQEGLRQLGQPIWRLETELLNPIIFRCLYELIRWGRIPKAPPEMNGQGFGIQYQGQIALALRDQEARGFQQWAGFVSQVAQIAPEALDSINWDKAIPRMGESFGVNSGDMATDEEIAAKREARAQQQQAMQQAQMAEQMGKAYKSGTAAPEAGSPSEALMGALK